MAEQQVKERDDTQDDDMPQDAPKGRNLPAIADTRLPYHPAFKERFGVTQSMWRVLVESVYPSARTIEGVLLAMAYCDSRKLDIMKKMCHVVPIWNSALGKEVESVWSAIAELRATAFRTGLYAGCDETNFGPMKSFHFEGRVKKNKTEFEDVKFDVIAPEWVQITVYRLVSGIRCAFPGPRILYLATYAKRSKWVDMPNEKWERSAQFMLEKCAEAAALRKAFPEELGDMPSAEEMEGQTIDGATGEIIDQEKPQPEAARPTRDQTRAASDSLRKEQNQQDHGYRQAMAEPATTANAASEDDGPAQEETRAPAQKQTQPEPETNEHVLVERTLRKKMAELKSLKLFKPAFIDWLPELEKMRDEDPKRRDALLADIFAKHPELKDVAE